MYNARQCAPANGILYCFGSCNRWILTCDMHSDGDQVRHQVMTNDVSGRPLGLPMYARVAYRAGQSQIRHLLTGPS